MYRATLLAVVSLLVLPLVGMHADDKKDPYEAWEKAARVGPEHKLLEPLHGSWTFTTRMWLKPGEAPVEGSGTAERKWILGGRFLEERVTMKDAGGDFQGFGLTGYDNTQQKYTWMWADSMSTAIINSQGSYDKATRTLTFMREYFDPASKQKVKSRDVIKIINNDKHTIEMYKLLPDGKESKTMEIILTRKK